MKTSRPWRATALSIAPTITLSITLLAALPGTLSANAGPGTANAGPGTTNAGLSETANADADATSTADPYQTVVDQLQWRNIGPAIMGGRIGDFAVVESDPKTFYVATNSAGLWKTTNNGTTFEPLFQDQPVSSIGDVTLAPNDPSIVWVGTGEPTNRQSSSWGNGVYRSTDSGETWTHMGLEGTHHIGRIQISPHDSDTVYVAALGHLWGANEERGIYKTTDGGKTWTRSLFIDQDTGFVDLAMDPESPGTLYAGAYQRRRRVFGFSGGGPGGGLYKTTDGGDTWTRLTEGLPEGDIGRVGVAIYLRDPRIVYALIEHKEERGLYRSQDKGASWTKVSDENPRPMYYSQVQIDPNNDQRIWVMGARMSTSEDGGKTFVTDRVQRIHGDHHAMWINPADSDHMILGSDGGVHLSYDRGFTWDFINTMALGQFYEIGYDMETPYNVYGGLQDNGSWGGPVRTLYQQGITNEDWFRVGGGDGFYTQVDPTDPSILYVESQNGNLQRLELGRSERKNIRPEPGPDEDRYRFDWNSPIVISHHDPSTIYYGGNRLFISNNRGDDWSKTEDLTRQIDRDELPIMGKMLSDDTLSRNDGISTFGQIVTIAESPLDQNVLYVGTDDGNVQVSRDGGETWTNVADRLDGVPDGTYVTRVTASAHDKARVFATFDGHRENDYGSYVQMSNNYGQRWQSLAASLPEGHTLNVVREHPGNANLLFAGGEFGAYVSFDRGQAWYQFGGQFPTVPVDDIAIHPRDNDLLVGTHGRSIWVLDDIAPLVELSDKTLGADVHLFPIRDAVSYRISNHKGNTGHKMFIAPNPPSGALLHYTLSEEVKPEEPEGEEETAAERGPGRRPGSGGPRGRGRRAADGPVKITITDADGDVVRTMSGPGERGLNRVNWDLRHDSPMPAGQGGRGGFGRSRGPRVPPGLYTVTAELGDAESSAKVRVSDDPRIQISDEAREALITQQLRVGEILATMSRGQRRAEGLKDQIAEIQGGLGGDEIPQEVKDRVQETLDSIDELAKQLSRNGGRENFFSDGLPFPLFIRIARLGGSFDGYTEAPDPDKVAQIDEMEKEVEALMQRLRQVSREDIPALNEVLAEANVPHIRLAGPGGGRERGRR